MKKMVNVVKLEGKLYESSLEIKVSKKGVEYIGGKIELATDDDNLNIVSIDYPYVAKRYSNGKENKNYSVLNSIIENGKSIVGNPDEEPTLLRIDSNIDLNEWYKNENGEDVLVSTRRVAGGFTHIIKKLSNESVRRNRFECDMVITNSIYVEADEEANIPEDKMVIKGCVFNYKNDLLPIEFTVLNQGGIDYFDSLDISPNAPIFTKVWGEIINKTITTSITEESAFGEPVVKEVKKNKKDWVLTGTMANPYEFDDEGTILASELKECMSNRQITLATKLQEQKEREAEKRKQNNGFSTKSGNFSF